MRTPYNAPMRYLGVDPGGSRFGLALGDDITGVVTALSIVPYVGAEGAARTIVEVARTHNAERVVMGLPTSADGSETPACRRSHAIADAITGLGLEVSMQPEYLSTDEARRRARHAGMGPREPVDHIAAQVLLEDFLMGRGQ